MAALSPDADAEVASMNELYRRRRDLVCDALREIGVEVHPPHAHDLRVGAGAGGL